MCRGTLEPEVFERWQMGQHCDEDRWWDTCASLTAENKKDQHVHSAHGYENALTPNSRCVRVVPRGSDQPCKTRGGPSMHHSEIFRKPVRVMSCDHTASPRSLWVRIVSSRSGSPRITSRNARRVVSLLELSSIHVMEWRCLHSARALSVLWVMCGYRTSKPR